MNIKATKDGRIVVVEIEDQKVGIFVTPMGVAVTDGRNTELEPEIIEPDEEWLRNEFGEAGEEYIRMGFHQVEEEINRMAQMMCDNMDNTIGGDGSIYVHGEEVEETPCITTEMNNDIDYAYRHSLMCQFAAEYENRAFDYLDSDIQEQIWRVFAHSPNHQLNDNLKELIRNLYDREVDDPLGSITH